MGLLPSAEENGRRAVESDLKSNFGNDRYEEIRILINAYLRCHPEEEAIALGTQGAKNAYGVRHINDPEYVKTLVCDVTAWIRNVLMVMDRGIEPRSPPYKGGVLPLS
jgi:hypothetical protein